MGLYFSRSNISNRFFNEAEVDTSEKEEDTTKDEEEEDYTSGADTAGDDDTPSDDTSGDDSSSSDDEDYTSGAETAGDDDTPDDTSAGDDSSGDDEDYTSGAETAGDDDTPSDDTSGGDEDYTSGAETAGDDTSEDSSGDSGSDDEDYTSGAETAGDSDSSDSGDDTSSDDTSEDSGDSEESSGDEEGEGDDISENIKKIESELFSNLTPEQIAIKNTELKERFIEVYTTIGSALVRINDVTKSADNVETLQFVTTKLLELRDMVDYNITVAYSTRSYIENNIIYQQCLSTLNAIIEILDTIKSDNKEDETLEADIDDEDYTEETIKEPTELPMESYSYNDYI